MKGDRDFIRRVKADKLLYAHGTDRTKRQKSWASLAKALGLQSANSAEQKWLAIVTDYVAFLRHGSSFAYARDMQFMQTHIFDDSSEIESSESELDEAHLKEILISDEDDQTEADHLAKQSAEPTQIISEEPSAKNTIQSEATNSFSSFTALELMFLGYARVLEKMPRPLQMKTKWKITQIMNEAEMELLD